MLDLKMILDYVFLQYWNVILLMKGPTRPLKSDAVLAAFVMRLRGGIWDVWCRIKDTTAVTEECTAAN